LEEAVRLGHRIVVLSRRPGMVREILEIDLPLDARAAHASDLEAHRNRLWRLIRDEAQAVDLELVDG
ncbi:MAG: ABC transporter ATP-binding protein, partial [Alphaproteobacteria bacterium]|nr:ABC transporter ATP-binding protein [Alphaproteobacteria bacterium]